jgi:hypothetical protein
MKLQKTDGSWIELDEDGFNTVDAEESVDVIVLANHFWIANSQGPGEYKLSPCVLDWAWLGVPGVLAVKVHSTVVKVIWENNPKTLVRYDVPKDGKEIQHLNDTYKNKELFEALPLTITFSPPRRTHSLEYLRSPEKREINKRYVEKLKAGKEIRPYTAPSSRGYRSGNHDKLFGS